MRHVDTPQTRCRVGAAQTDITPPVGIYHRMWGAAAHDRATGTHRPLLATALWLEPASGDPGQARLVIALDHCVIDGPELARLRAAAAGAALAPEQVLITLSHTHGSGWLSSSRAHLPGGELIAPYLDEVARCLAALAAEARQAAQPATIVYGQGRCSLAAQRDYLDTDLGGFVCGFNPEAGADDTVLVARVSGASGCLATVVNYACHPTTLAWDNTKISPDYVGAMRELVERATGAPCVFLQGASGDLGPREGFVGDPAVADRNGRQLGHAALSALEALPPPGTRFAYAGPVVSGTTIGTWKHVSLDAESLQRQQRWELRTHTVELPYRDDLPNLAEAEAAQRHWLAEQERALAAGDDQKARDCRALAEQEARRAHRARSLPAGNAFPYRANVWRLGDAVWLLVPGELYQAFQLTLRRRFPQWPVVVATLTDGWQPGYLPAAASYGQGIYQETIAAVAAGALEVLTEALAQQIEALVLVG
jgi:hypothetical protein